MQTVLAMRKMKNGGPYKPYAIIDQHAYDATIGELKQELRFNGLACRTNRGYPSEAEFKSASI